MNIPTLWWPVQRLLERHLSRLRESIEELGERLREALAQAVGRAVAGAVREVVHRLTLPAGLPSERCFDPAWDRNERNGWDDDRSPWTRDAYEDDEPLDDDEPLTTRPTMTSAPSRWLRAAAVGLQAAAWLLRRRLGQFPLAAALGLGLLATTGAYFTTPALLAAGAGVAGVAFGVLNLVENAASV